jgi:3-keto-disaccharide hydrolase
MKTLQFIFANILVFSLFLACGAGKKQGDGFIPLFDGKTLNGWHADGGELDRWEVRDGVIICDGGGGGWLTTDKEYADFVLSLEWRIPEGGNSGVGLRYPPESYVSRAGMEIQILDDDAPKHKDIKPEQYTGSIYYQVAAKRGAARPVGEWNRYLITCDGPLVVIELNGTEITRADMDKHTVGKGDLTPLSQRPRKGYVGLQNHDKSWVEFRDIRIKVLNR